MLGLIPSLLILLISIYVDPSTLLQHISRIFNIKFIEAAKYAAFPIDALEGGLFALVVTAFSVIWHRQFLVNSETQTIKNLFMWHSRQFKFLYVVIVFGIVGSLVFNSVFITGFMLISESPSLQSSLLQSVGKYQLLKIFASLVVSIIVVRWSIMFPSIAVDKPFSFNQGWRITKGNGFRLFIISILVILPFYFLVIPIRFIILLGEFPGLELINSLFFMVTTAVGVSALSASYRDLCGEA